MHEIRMLVASPEEIFVMAMKKSRELSAKILNLADIQATPLTPGETADMRRHQIAKLGKQLAEAFTIIEQLVAARETQLGLDDHDVTAGPTAPEADKPIDPNSN